MKIGILTFHAADNYGAVLQAYGLKEVLCRLGHEVHIIDYSPEYLKHEYRPLRNDAFYSMKQFAKALSVVPIRVCRNLNFSQFRKSHLSLLPVDKINGLDAIIVGSDQVWNPNITDNRFDPMFLLADKSLKPVTLRIAYAASAGNVKEFSANYDETVENALSSFNAISVREESLANYLSGRGFEPIVTLDPVLLPGKDVFDSMTSRKLVPKTPYLLCFSLQTSPKLRKTAKTIAASRGVGLVELVSVDESIFRRDLVQTASIEKFLSLIKYADAVVTTSFHGTAFSLLFNRPFLSVGYDNRHSERVRMLLKSVDAESNYANIGEPVQTEIPALDFEKIDRSLAQQRRDSYLFINQSITPLKGRRHSDV